MKIYFEKITSITQVFYLRFVLLTVIFFSLNTIPLKSQNIHKDEPVTVDSVDLNKYAGLWYEIAKIPNSFQSKCDHNTTAEYKLRDDGKIDVINKCIEKDGSVNVANGIAKVVDSKTNSKLEVSFVRILGISLFWGDYWIIGLDKDYKYAVIGTPTRKYGWILSRTPKLSESNLDTIFKLLLQQGYNPKDFQFTVQKY